MTEKIVLTLTKHPLWGNLLQPVLVEVNDYGTLTILEFADSKSTGFGQLNDLSKEILLLSEEMTDTALMANFSKEKTIAAFHKKVKPDVVENLIRPFIEQIQRKMVLLLSESKLPFYVRENVKIRNLYETELATVPEDFTKVTFHFAKEEESCIHYSINIEYQDEELDLFSKQYSLLSSEPAAIVINKKLLIFEDIDIKKLVPFFTKREIEIPLSYETTYIKTFIRNCLENNEVMSEGIEIKEIKPAKKAELSIETDSNNMPVMKMTLSYEKNEYPLDFNSKKIVQVVEKDGKASLKWFHPDKEWEKTLIGKLLKGGMEKTGPQHFSLKKNKTEYLIADQIKNMADWMAKHKDVMKHFEFNQELPG